MTRDELVAAIRERARVLYEGKVTPHRSCGMAIAEAMGREPRPYHALRRGGLSGLGHCGAILAGQLVLGELFGDPAPGAPVSPALKEAMTRFQAEVARRLPKGPGGTIVCNDLTSQFPIFQSEERAAFCTGLAADVAEILAGIAVDLGATLDARPIEPR
jgi:hypothetical protein